MSKKSKNMKEEWVNPDDAPEANEEWFKNAHVNIGDTLIKRGSSKRLSVNRFRSRRPLKYSLPAGSILLGMRLPKCQDNRGCNAAPYFLGA